MLMKIGKEWSQENGCFTADHLSASQINLDLAIWFMKYCVWDAAKRKKLPPSISMMFGAIVGRSLQDINQFNLTINQVMNGR